MECVNHCTKQQIPLILDKNIVRVNRFLLSCDINLMDSSSPHSQEIAVIIGMAIVGKMACQSSSVQDSHHTALTWWEQSQTKSQDLTFQ